LKLEIEGRVLNYRIDGSGEDLLLIHGFGDNLNVWYHQLPVFSKDFRVIGYDLMGSGESDISVEESSVGSLANDAYRLLRNAGVKRAYVLGHSLGGLVACRLAIDHPEMVKGLILANSIPISTVHHPKIRKSSSRILELFEQSNMEKAAEIMVESGFSPDFKLANPEEFQRYLRAKLSTNPVGLVKLLKCKREPLDVGRLACPVMIVLGEKDLFISARDVTCMQEVLPHLQIFLLPCGHVSFIELPEQFNSIVLKFLQNMKSADTK
jgi:pimeloyl-ACP methyl ester carboxylesterase